MSSSRQTSLSRHEFIIPEEATMDGNLTHLPVMSFQRRSFRFTHNTGIDLKRCRTPLLQSHFHHKVLLSNFFTKAIIAHSPSRLHSQLCISMHFIHE